MMPTEKGPALSVVVPTNSRVALFLETLASLERQSLDSFELIVTDDSRLPTDRMAIREATMKYADRTGRATRYLFSDPGLGQARNTNQGLTAASGHLIRILHSDDLLARRALEAEIALMSDPRLCIEFLFHYCVPFVNSPRFDNQPVLSLVQPAHFFRNRMHSGTPLPSGVVFTASALREVGPMQSNLDFLCDWEFVARLILREHKYNRFLGSLSQGFVGWREHQESTTGRFWHKHFLEHEQFIEDICRNSELCVELFPDEQARAIFRTIAVRYRYCRLSRDVSRLQMSRLIREMPQILHCVLSVRSLLELLRPAPWTAIGSLLYPKIKSSSPGSLPRKQKQPGRKLADPRGGLRFALSAHFARKVISWGNAWAERQMNRDLGLKGGNQAFSGTAGAADPGPAPLPAIRAVEIIPGYDSGDHGTDKVRVIADYNNQLQLWSLRHLIRGVSEVIVAEANCSIFHERILHECLKFTAPGTEVKLRLMDNVLLTSFGAKAEVDRLFPGQFAWVDQSGGGGNHHILCYRRDRAIHPTYSAVHTGWTFGMLTSGKRLENVCRFVDSIKRYCPDSYEIIVIAPAEIEMLAQDENVRVIPFREHDDRGWITRKKNIICEQAAFSDLLICHDRFWLDEDFFRAFASWGYSYGLAAPRVRLPDGRRALDWAIVGSRNRAWSSGGQLSYFAYSQYAYNPGGATLMRREFWRDFPWNENLFWNEHEDVELCRRIQDAGHPILLARSTVVAAEDRWLGVNPPVPYCEHIEVVYGHPVSEQRILFLPNPKSAA